MKIATWNVNSLRARLTHVERWLRETEPDVVLLQETKVTDDEFPLESLARAGYEAAFAGQKTYNGVAILARRPLEAVRVGFRDAAPDEDRRLLEATTNGLTILSAYVPNGKTLDSPSYPEKLTFLERLRETIVDHHAQGRQVVLGGDFNVCFDERDVFDVATMTGQLHFSDPERERMRSLVEAGLVDAFRRFEGGPAHYSWWDYRMGAFRRNRGLRIDYLFVSDALAPRLRSCHIDRSTRSWDKPSDHAPVVLELSA